MAYNNLTLNKHATCFPSKIAASAGSPHIYNITLTTDADNGNIIGRGGYKHLDNYAEADCPSGFAAVIREQAPNGNWRVEVTAVPDGEEALLVYNSPIIPYETPRELADDSNFYNAAGEVVKAYTLILGDLFEVSDEAFSGTPAKGKTLTVASKKLVVGA